MVSNPGSVTISNVDFKCALRARVDVAIDSTVDQEVTISLPVGVKGRIDGVNENFDNSIAFDYVVDSETTEVYVFPPVAEIYNETLTPSPVDIRDIARNSTRWYGYNRPSNKVMYFNSSLSESPDGYISDTFSGYGEYGLACDDTYIYTGRIDTVRVLAVDTNNEVLSKVISATDISSMTVDDSGRPIVLFEDGAVNIYADYTFNSVVDTIDISAYMITTHTMQDAAFQNGVLYLNQSYDPYPGTHSLHGFELDYAGSYTVVVNMDVATAIGKIPSYLDSGIEFDANGRLTMIYLVYYATTIVLKNPGD